MFSVCSLTWRWLCCRHRVAAAAGGPLTLFVQLCLLSVAGRADILSPAAAAAAAAAATLLSLYPSDVIGVAVLTAGSRYRGRWPKYPPGLARTAGLSAVLRADRRAC